MAALRLNTVGGPVLIRVTMVTPSRGCGLQYRMLDGIEEALAKPLGVLTRTQEAIFSGLHLAT